MKTETISLVKAIGHVLIALAAITASALLTYWQAHWLYVIISWFVAIYAISLNAQD